MHLPLVGTKGARMRVGDEKVHLQQGKTIVFDDSFNHEAWHDGKAVRINLIIDFWHPDLSDLEVEFFQTILNSRIKAENDFCDKIGDQGYLEALIVRTKDMLPNNDDWWLT